MFPPFFGRDGGAGSAGNEDMRVSLDAYHRELAKLQSCPPNQIGQNMSGLLGLHAAQSAASNPPSNNATAGSNNSSSNNTSSAGNQSHPPMSNGIIQDLSLPKSERKPEPPKLPNGDISNDKMEFKKESSAPTETSFSEAMKHGNSAFSLVRPKTEPGKLALLESAIRVVAFGVLGSAVFWRMVVDFLL